MNSTLSNLKYDPDQGALCIGPIRYLLIRPETLADIQKGIEDRLGPKSGEYLYAAGAAWAVNTMKRLKSALPEGPSDLAQALCQQASQLGWGRWELAGWKPNHNQLAVRIHDSPLASTYGQSDIPICHLLAGSVGGMAESLFNMPTACTEKTCRAQGDPNCLFIAVGHDVAGVESWDW